MRFSRTTDWRLILLLPVLAGTIAAQDMDQSVVERHGHLVMQMIEHSLRHGEAFAMLEELTSKAGHRLSGSRGAGIAVQLTKEMMDERGFSNVHFEPVMVPHWVRGPVERAEIPGDQGKIAIPLSICALGGSIATPEGGIEAEVIEVKSFEELQTLGERAFGKIVFFNRPMDPSKLSTFEAYGGAVNQRGRGAIEAAKAGGVAALVRSMTLSIDNVPHTGAMHYVDSIPKVPAAAISTRDADMLSELLKSEGSVKVRMMLTCEILPDVESANVVGELTGTERPKEIIVVGGHLDSWDKGTGAHDDGSGCVQAIEALNILKNLGIRPKRTIRAVMFMNEENGVRGGRAYPVAPQRVGETHIAAIESDAGGHAPRGFNVKGDSTVLAKVLRWRPLFGMIDAERIRIGYAGVDIDPLVGTGVPGFGLVPENHRYFDYHHSDHDTIDKVNRRELQMGAIVEALLCYLISEEGLE